MSIRRVSFPHMGNYHVVASTIAELFGDEVIVPPKNTRQTLELGAKFSPEAVCVPFKYTLGNFIEVLEKGANVLVQVGGGCRMGFYGEVQKAILTKLGYKFEFVKLTNSHNIITVARNIKQLKPHLSYREIAGKLRLAYLQTRVLDEIESRVRIKAGFEKIEGSCERLVRQQLVALNRAKTATQVRDIQTEFESKLSLLEVVQPDYLLRVGIIGEIYLVMEPFSNFFLEKELARRGIEVHRLLSISGVIAHGMRYKSHIKHMLAEAHPYLKNAVGAHGTESVARAHRFAKDGFDGLIHVKPFGCMPEINAMPALHRISQDYGIPIMFFSFDALTSETGIKTRIEAFHDMLLMKKGHWKSARKVAE